MITKIKSISYLKNALNYCERGGEIIASFHCLGNSSQIFSQINTRHTFNDRCQKNTFHAKIRIAPEDKGILNTQDWIDISNKYAHKIGFNNNPYVVYIHEENTEKEHIHIVGSRINEYNIAISDSFLHYKNLDFCREIEKAYKLRKVSRRLEKLKANEEFIASDYRIDELKKEIFDAIKMSDSVENLINHLKSRNIKTKKGRGISFIDSKGVSRKGSSIDRRLSLSGIIKLIEQKNQNIKSSQGPSI